MGSGSSSRLTPSLPPPPFSLTSLGADSSRPGSPSVPLPSQGIRAAQWGHRFPVMFLNPLLPLLSRPSWSRCPGTSVPSQHCTRAVKSFLHQVQSPHTTGRAGQSRSGGSAGGSVVGGAGQHRARWGAGEEQNRNRIGTKSEPHTPAGGWGCDSAADLPGRWAPPQKAAPCLLGEFRTFSGERSAPLGRVLRLRSLEVGSPGEQAAWQRAGARGA